LNTKSDDKIRILKCNINIDSGITELKFGILGRIVNIDVHDASIHMVLGEILPVKV
jgi:hypothetical protein